MANTDYLPCIEIETGPRVPANVSIIGLHGLGAHGHDLASLVSDLPIKHSIRWIFPHAPVRPVSLHGGARVRAWYDIYGLGLGAQEDSVGLRTIAKSIERLIERELARGIPSAQILLFGFSQGGALALYTGLRYLKRLAGVMALSGYLPLAKRLTREASAANRRTAIFMAHGTQDEIVSLEIGEESMNYLREGGYPVEFHRYSMAHTICAQEREDMKQWIEQRLSL